MRRWLYLMRGIKLRFDENSQGQESTQRKLASTFDFLLAIVCGFVTAILVWAVAVGVAGARIYGPAFHVDAANGQIAWHGIVEGIINSISTFLANALGAFGAATMVAAGS